MDDGVFGILIHVAHLGAFGSGELKMAGGRGGLWFTVTSSQVS